MLQNGGFSGYANRRSRNNIGATINRMNYRWKIKGMTKMLEGIIKNENENDKEEDENPSFLLSENGPRD